MKLSIIIPVYNVEKYLPTCLDSVLNNNLPDYEVIIVNDGSTDSCSDIISEYYEQYQSIIKIIDKPNGGLGSARNAGINIATGDYLVFLDSDDYLANNAVNEMLDTIKNNCFDICFFDQVYFNENGDEIMRFSGADRENSFTFKEYPQILFRTPNAGNKIFKRSLFIDNNIFFPPRQWFEDVNSVYLLYPLAQKMLYVKKAWNCHLQRKGSITNSSNTVRNLEMITAVQDLFEFYKKIDLVSEELEYCIFYNELLTSVDRVNLIDKESAVQDELVNWFIKTFPDFKKNKYIKNMSVKYKLLTYLILKRKYSTLNTILRINARKY